jgi:hypothetical protein
MTPAWLPFATLMVAVIGVGITIVLNTRAQGRIEGTITQGLADHGKRIDEHKADTTKRIDEVKADFNKKVDDLADTDDEQWRKIGEHSTDIANIKGRMNGKANGATV